jgi:hypothetical protein
METAPHLKDKTRRHCQRWKSSGWKSFENAFSRFDVVQLPLRSMSSSPEFLIFGGEPGLLDDYAPADRLLCFLEEHASSGAI